MDRKKTLEWVNKAEEVFNKHTVLVTCPNNRNHMLSYSMIPYVKYSKIELILECRICNIKKVFTTSIPDSSNDLDESNVVF